MENEQKETYMSATEEKVTIALIILEIFIGLLALLTIFLPALATQYSSYEGVFTTFGGGSDGGMVTKFFKFSFGNFLAYFLVVAAMVLSFVRLAMPKIDNIITKCVTAGIFFLAGILFILCKQMTILNINTSMSIFKLAYGPLLAMIASIIDIIIIGVDIWFQKRISLLPAKEKEPITLTEEELRAQVMAEIEEEKRQEANNKE
jgi:hypothetical protein